MSSPVFNGIIAVPATPFTADGRVDTASLQRYAQKALAAGVVGFLAPADAGEVDRLSPAERELVVTTLLDEAKGRVPVIGGATDADPRACIEHARRFIALGCTGVLAFLRYTDDESYTAQVRALDGLNPGFLMVQELDRGGTPVPVTLLVRLHRTFSHFTWYKLETSDRCQKLTALREATGGSLHIGTAGPEMIELMDRGAEAYMPTLYHDVYARIWNLHRAGKREQAIALYYRLLPCLAFAAGHKAIKHQIKKAVLHAEGVFATRAVRASERPPDAIEARLLDEICDYGRALEKQG